MKSIGNVELTMGLVNCPVQMMTAIDSHDRKASMYHHHDADNSYGKVKMPKICEGCGEIVQQSDITNAFDESGQIVMLSPDEMETVAVKSGSSFEIPRFIHAKQVNPMMFSGENAYYLVPDPKRGKTALATYLTIRQVMAEQDLVGIVQYTRWKRNRIALLRIAHTEYGGVLVIQNMIWPDELREPEFPVLATAGDSDIDPRLLPVGRAVIESMTEDWNPDDYHDTYMEELSAAIEAKAAGKEIEAAEADDREAAPDDVAALIAQLEATAKAKQAAAAPAKKASTKKQVA